VRITVLLGSDTDTFVRKYNFWRAI